LRPLRATAFGDLGDSVTECGEREERNGE